MRVKFALIILVLFASLVYADVAMVGGPVGIKGFLIDVAVTLAIEIAVSFVYLRIKKLPMKILKSVVIANVISVTLLQLILYMASGTMTGEWVIVGDYLENIAPVAIGIVYSSWISWMILFLEILVVIFEAFAIFYMNKKEVRMNNAFTMSFLNNLASFVIGFFIIFLFFNEVIPTHHVSSSQCTLPPGFSCVSDKLYTNGSLYLRINQSTGYTIVVTGVTCTKNTSIEFPSNGTIYWGANRNVTIPSGSQATVADPANQDITVKCLDAAGNVITQPEGATYSGRIYINYTERDRNLQRIVVGTYTTSYKS